MTKEEFLEDTVKYYSEDVLRRNIEPNRIFYAPLHKNTEGCAIGRKIPLSIAKYLDRHHSNDSLKQIFHLLPEELQKLGLDFLQKIQLLHDVNAHWNSEGLSEKGIKYINQIKDDILKNSI